VVGLAYGEYLLREEQGERPTLDEYQRRFPEHARRLRQQVELHQVLLGHSAASPEAGEERTFPTRTPAEEPDGVPVVPGYEVLQEVGRGGMAVAC
jgi:hypothetical protein